MYSVLKIVLGLKMGLCAAVNCNKRNDKKKGYVLYCLPKDEKLRKAWIINLKRENLPEDTRVCHLHFEESCFKRDLEVCKHFFLYFMLWIQFSQRKLAF